MIPESHRSWAAVRLSRLLHRSIEVALSSFTFSAAVWSVASSNAYAVCLGWTGRATKTNWEAEKWNSEIKAWKRVRWSHVTSTTPMLKFGSLEVIDNDGLRYMIYSCARFVTNPNLMISLVRLFVSVWANLTFSSPRRISSEAHSPSSWGASFLAPSSCSPSRCTWLTRKV